MAASWRKTDVDASPKSGLRHDAPLNIGIAWQGNPEFPGDYLRSIPLKYFEKLAQVPGIRLVSLQKELKGTDQLPTWSGQVPLLDLSDRLESFCDTAAVMKNLDLVVSSCTSVAHLAGALGVPVWTALQFVPDWRWLLNRSDSPWYPTMRLFRQKKPGAWDEVFRTHGRGTGSLLARLRLGSHCRRGSASPTVQTRDHPVARQSLEIHAFPGGAWERGNEVGKIQRNGPCGPPAELNFFLRISFEIAARLWYRLNAL